MSIDDVEPLPAGMKFVEWSWFEDCAAESALAAGPLRVDLRDVELGYEHRVRTSPVIKNLFADHQELDNGVDEGYEIRGYLYVIEFDDGWLKLGCSRNPMDRLVRNAKSYYRYHGGMRITRMWVSIPHLTPKQSEQRLVRLASRCGAFNNFPRRETGEKHGESEMYFGLSFDVFTKMAEQQLDLVPLTAESAERELGARRKTTYEREMRQFAIKHWNTHFTFENFVLPESTKLYTPTRSTAPLTDLDLTTHDGLMTLIGRYGFGDELRMPPVAAVEAIEQPVTPSMWTRLRELFRRRWN